MNLTSARTTGKDFDGVPADPSSRGVPWPIWIVVFMLALEGLANLAAIPYEAPAARWLAFKCLAIVGLLRGWRWVYVLTLVVAVQHVVGFGMAAPFPAFLNAVIVLLVASSFRHFFLKAPPEASPDVLKPQVREVSNSDLDA